MYNKDFPLIRKHSIHLGLNKQNGVSITDVTVLGNSIAEDNAELGNEIVCLSTEELETLLSIVHSKDVSFKNTITVTIVIDTPQEMTKAQMKECLMIELSDLDLTPCIHAEMESIEVTDVVTERVES